MELDKAALDRWITREPPEGDEEESPEITAMECDYCGQDHCECDKLQAEQEAEAQRLIY